MSNPAVTFIPATISRYTSAPIHEQRQRRVAAYARVSTDHAEQQTSYEAQVDYYTKMIHERADWEFTGIYTDEGISATSTAKRDGFKKMVADAIAGKIDLIVTKSVSRFARNTVDSLSTIRKLKEHGCEVFFEKENIWTFDSKGELLITIMSSLAQEESRSISENVTWGQRKRFADGKVAVPYSRFLGYDKGENGTLKLNEAEAVIVRRIYQMFLEGTPPYRIARTLTEEGIPAPAGGPVWNQGTIQRMLTNEKYKGDALLQKSYIADFLTKKQVVNNGEIPQYYVEGAHEPIIDPVVFDMVQREYANRRLGKKRNSGISIFASRIECGECGSWYGAKTWHSTSKYRRVIYRCNGKYDGDQKCDTRHLIEADIRTAFLDAVNQLLASRDEIITNLTAIQAEFFDTTALATEQAKLKAELGVITGLINEAIAENARVAQDQAEYQQRHAALVERYDATKQRLTEVTEQTANRKNRSAALEAFTRELRDQPQIIEKWDARLWVTLVDHITVTVGGKITVTFKDGSIVSP